jgi:hypothetical protein
MIIVVNNFRSFFFVCKVELVLKMPYQGLMKKLFSSPFVGRFNLSGRNGKIAIGVSETFKVVIGKCLDFCVLQTQIKYLSSKFNFTLFRYVLCSFYTLAYSECMYEASVSHMCMTHFVVRNVFLSQKCENLRNVLRLYLR